MKNMELEYYEKLEQIASKPDEAYPDYLFAPLTNDFGIDYYNLGTIEDPMVSKARNLRRKYSNYFAYIDALEVYNDYKQYLIDKYGSWGVVKASMKIGTIDDFIPAKPKLKSKKINKEMLRSGITPSRKIYDIDQSIIHDSISYLPADDVSPFDTEKLPKDIRKMLKSSAKKVQQTARANSLYNRYGRDRGTDIIIDLSRKKLEVE